jgi:hypothetical protein
MISSHPKGKPFNGGQKSFSIFDSESNFWPSYPKGSSFELIGYSDLNWAGDKVDRKSTSRACQFLGRSLVSWYSRK